MTIDLYAKNFFFTLFILNSGDVQFHLIDYLIESYKKIIS